MAQSESERLQIATAALCDILTGANMLLANMLVSGSFLSYVREVQRVTVNALKEIS
jgi:hypothetical protein